MLDTNVLISALGRSTDTDNRLQQIAESVIQKCLDSGFKMCISERTTRELEKGWNSGNITLERIEKERKLLVQFSFLSYHMGNETWDKIEGKWENIGSLWNNEEESAIADEIEALLPGTRNQHDRGILLDAIYNDCYVVISENWSDFKRIREIGSEYGVRVCKPGDFLLLE